MINPPVNQMNVSHNISEIQGLSTSNIGPSSGGSNYSSKKASLCGSRIMHSFKLILLGDVYVGKTCLFNRFIQNTTTEKYQCNINVEMKKKNIYLDQTSCAELEIWDTCGEEKFRSLTRQYYRLAQGVILLFDLTVKESFDHLERWLNDFNSNGSANAEIVIVGNKKDLQSQRMINQKEAEEFAAKHKKTYIEISAFTGFNVELLFEKVTHMLVKKEQEKNEKEELKIQQQTFHKKTAIEKKLKDNNAKREVGCC